MNCKKFGRAAASMALVMSVVSTSAMAAPADLMGHDRCTSGTIICQLR